MSGHRTKSYLWSSALVILGLAIIGGTFFWLSQSSVLAIESIEVDGNKVMTEEQVMEIAAPRLQGESLLQFSFDDVDRALRDYPYVESVELSRDFPHTINIEIREYRPVARYTAADGNEYLLSKDARVLAQSEPQHMAIPVLKTVERCRAEVGVFIACSDVEAGVVFIDLIPVNLDQDFVEVRVDEGIIDAITSSGIEVRFGTLDEHAYKFEVLRQLIARSIAAGDQVVIDISVPDRPVTRDKTVPPPEEEATDDSALESEVGAATDDAAAGEAVDEQPAEQEVPVVEDGQEY
jgi:cell division protein FtsQ